MPQLYIEMFGGLRTLHEGRVLAEFPPQQASALLAYLALHLHKRHNREELVALLWPEAEIENDRQRLRQTLHLLRQQLEQPPFDESSVLLADRHSIQLDPSLVRTDVAEFEDALKQARQESDLQARIHHLKRATDLYRGELLPGFYQECFDAPRRHLEEARWQALRELTQAYEQTGALESAIESAQRVLALNPLIEETHGDLMRLRAALGQPAAVQRQYQKLRDTWQEAFQEEPSEPSRALYQALLNDARRLASERAANGAPPEALPNQKNAAPGSVTSVRDSPVARGWWGIGLTASFAVCALALLLLWHPWTRRSKPPAPPAPTEETVKVGDTVMTLNKEEKEQWWFQKQAGDGDSAPTAILFDRGSIYICGFVQTANQGADMVIFKLSPNLTLRWSKRYDGPKHGDDYARSLAVDGEGNVYVTGESYNGDPKQGGTGWDIVTVKFDENGKNPKEIREGSKAEEKASKVVVDRLGNIYVTGYRDGGSSDQGGTGKDCLTIKCNSEGRRLWKDVFSGPSRLDDCGKDIALDEGGNVYVAGYSQNREGTVIDSDFLTIKYDAAGKRQWSELQGGLRHGNDMAEKIAYVNDRIFVTGVSWCDLKDVHQTRIRTVCYRPSRYLEWVRNADGPWEYPRAMALDVNYCVLIAGDRFRTVKYNHYGDAKWEETVVTSAENFVAYGITADPFDNVYVTGSVDDGAGISKRSYYLTRKYTPDGKLLWSRAYRGKNKQGGVATGVVADKVGNAYVVGQAQGEKTRDIVLIKYAGRENHPTLAQQNQHPVLDATTADAMRIVYDKGPDGHRDIYVMKEDGSQQTCLVNHPADDFDAIWSPDGRQIAFLSDRDDNVELYTIKADGGSLKCLTTDSVGITEPAWSPDGRRIAFASRRHGNREIYVMNANGTGLRRLTHNTHEDYTPCWSPSGGEIAFASDREGSYDIYKMNADGSNPIRLTHHPRMDTDPCWSPNGRWIAFVSNRDARDEIYKMNVDGTEQQRLTREVGNVPCWLPDSAWILFNRARNDNGDLYLTHHGAMTVVRLTTTPVHEKNSVQSWRY